jgi:hypothetical protein
MDHTMLAKESPFSTQPLVEIAEGLAAETPYIVVAVLNKTSIRLVDKDQNDYETVYRLSLG